MKRIKVHQIGKGNFGNKISEVIKDNVQFVSSTDADWIIISTPNDLHYEQVKYWLTQKKNVFCEKPLTLTYETSEELFNLADKNNVRLYVDDVFSWHDNIQRLTKWSKNVDFKWYKYGSFNANIIDNLAYHHFYLWVGSTDFEIKDIYSQYYNSNGLLVTITLVDGRSATLDYNILSDEYQHTINGFEVNPTNNPLQDMLISVFNDNVDYNSNRRKTLNAIKLCEVVKKEVLPKVLVVGGGIFGTTSSVMLSTSGYNVDLQEELDDVMKCASGINQYRLHSGYHYPRSKETVEECINGLKLFKRKYESSLVTKDINHFYSISSENSLVSANEYIKFLDDMELDYNIHDTVKGTDLTIEVDEELFDSDKLRSQVLLKMRGVGVNLFLNKKTRKNDFDSYDYILITTYSKINELLKKKREYQFEVIEKPVVRLPDVYKNKSIVIMDGPFMCLDPYGDGLHILGNVVHAIHETNVGLKPIVSDELKKYLNNGIIHKPKITKINKFIEDGLKFFEDFDKMEHIGSMYTIRTVLSNREHDDARPTIVTNEQDNIYSIFSGKVGTCVQSAIKLIEEIKR